MVERTKEDRYEVKNTKRQARFEALVKEGQKAMLEEKAKREQAEAIMRYKRKERL